MLSNTLYMYGVDEETIPYGFEASTTAQRLHTAPAPSSDPGFQPRLPESGPASVVGMAL